MTCRSRPASKNVLRALAFCLGAFVISNGSQVQAQGVGFSMPDVPVLTIEPDRIFSDTRFGQNLSAELERRGAVLAAENRSIESDLADEESRLTVERTSMEPEAFRVLADAFDAKVQETRKKQDEKAQALTDMSDRAQLGFLHTIAPVLERMMVERGASVIMDRRSVFLSIDSGDVTEAAIQRIDEMLGDGFSLRELLAKDLSDKH